MYVRSLHTAEWASTGMIGNPARGQLNRGNEFSLSSFEPEKLVSRETSSAVLSRVSPFIVHTQAESATITITITITVNIIL